MAQHSCEQQLDRSSTVAPRICGIGRMRQVLKQVDKFMQNEAACQTALLSDVAKRRPGDATGGQGRPGEASGG